MKRFFIHHPLFRLLAPLFSGTLVYLLLLLVNNNIAQVKESFLGQELYTCIALTYMIQELIRGAILFFDRLKHPFLLRYKILFQSMATILAIVFLVSSVMYLYFKYVLRYTPNFTELSTFNIIFSFIGMVYIVLYFSHQYLYRANTEKIEAEKSAQKVIEEEFVAYKKGINPDLLFESLEAMLITMKSDPDGAEQFTDNFALVYRYLLAKRKTELVTLEDELTHVAYLNALFDQLPHRRVTLRTQTVPESWVPPTALLSIVEHIIRSTIASSRKQLEITIGATDQWLKISYSPEERLQHQFTLGHIAHIVRRYAFFSEAAITLKNQGGVRTLSLPILTYDERSHN